MSGDFWDDAAGNEDVPEPIKVGYADIPDGMNLICRTTDKTDKETVRPSIKEVDWEGKTFYKMKVPLIVVGGEGRLDPKFVGRYVFLELNVEKPTLEQLNKSLAKAKANGSEATATRLEGQIKAHDKYPCDPELYNLVLDTLAPVEGKAPERWAAAKFVLASVGKGLGYTPEMFKGNVQYLYAETFKQVLLGGQYMVIGKTYTPKQKEGKTYTPQQTLGSIGADTPEQRKTRKVGLIERPEDTF